MTSSFRHCRLERLFYCLISVFIVLALPARGAEPNKTIVADTIYRADGTPARGTLLISWPAFSSADGKPVAAGTLSVKIAANGSVNIPLVPTQGATPSGTAYKIVLSLDDGSSSTEYWAVPTLSPATIAAIRSTQVPATVAMQVVSREYVDGQLATAVRRNGDETISGNKTFESSPLVPSPGTEAAAANKGYVDVAIAAAAPSPSNVLNINKGGTGTNSFTPGRCVRIANDGSQLEAAGVDCGASADADTVDGRHAAEMQLKAALDVREAPYSAQCDLVSDDTDAIQAAINAKAAGGGTIVIPSGCKITRTLTLHNTTNVILTGVVHGGSNGSVMAGASGLLWCGAAGGTMLDIQNSIATRVQNMVLSGGSLGCMNGAGTLINIDRNAPGGGLNQSDTLLDSLTFQACEQGASCSPANYTAVYIARVSLSNVEDIRILNSTFVCGSGTCIRVGSSANPKNLEITHNFFYTGAGGTNIFLEGGSANITRNEFLTGSDGVVNVKITGCSDPTSVVENISEGDQQFVLGGCGYPSNQTLRVIGNNADVNAHWRNSNKYRFEFTGASDAVLFESNHFDYLAPGTPYKTVGNSSVSNNASIKVRGNLFPNNYLQPDLVWGSVLADVATFHTYTVDHAGQVAGGNRGDSARLNSYNFGAHLGPYRRRAIGVATNLSGPAAGQNVSPAEPVPACNYGAVCGADGQFEFRNIPPVIDSVAVYIGTAGTTDHSFRVYPRDAAGNRGQTVAVACNQTAALSSSNHCDVSWPAVPNATDYDVLGYCAAGSAWKKLATVTATSYSVTSDPCTGAAYASPTHDETGSAVLRVPLGLQSLRGGIWNWYSDAGSTLKASINGTTGAASFAALTIGGNAPLTAADKAGSGAKVASVGANPADGCAQFAGGTLTSTSTACGAGGGGAIGAGWFGVTVQHPTVSPQDSTVLGVVNRVFVFGFPLPMPVTVGHISTYLTVPGGAGKKYGICLFDASGQKVVETGALDANTVQGNSPSVGPVTLTAGYYYLGLTSDSPTTQLVGIAGNPGGSAGWMENQVVQHWGTAANAGNAGVCPATMGTVSGPFGGNFPMVYFQP